MQKKVMITKQPLLLLALLSAIGAFHLNLKKTPDEKTIERYASYMALSFEAVGKVAPECQFTFLTGEKINLSDIAGKKCIIINFFATWCEPCKREIPYLNEFYEKFSGEKLSMVGVSSEKKETIKKFLEENKIDFNVAIDDGVIERNFGISSYPTTVVIGADGRIQFYNTGAIYNTEATLEPIVKRILSEIESGKTISKEEFLKLSRAESPIGVREHKKKGKLTEKEQRIAKQIYCPRGCGKNLIECDCAMCKEAIEMMRKEIEKGTPETEIVKKINVFYCSVKEQ